MQKSRFFEICGVSARTRRVEPVWTFCGQGGQFSRFCADVLYGRPLIGFSVTRCQLIGFPNPEQLCPASHLAPVIAKIKYPIHYVKTLA